MLWNALTQRFAETKRISAILQKRWSGTLSIPQKSRGFKEGSGSNGRRGRRKEGKPRSDRRNESDPSCMHDAREPLDHVIADDDTAYEIET